MTVYLVGAGPGDPGLLTVRAAALLGRADCVVYDRLVFRALFDLVAEDAELIDVGKVPGGGGVPQFEINDLLVERGRAHEVVVRLKGGDPFLFGRGGEEAEALAAAGIAFEVVPGVTSAIAVPAYAGIPLTQRGLASNVTLVTGHASGDDADWEALGRLMRHGGTLVVLMGTARIAEIASALLEAGVSPDTPVASVRNGTRPDQETTRCVLADLAAGAVSLSAPSAIVIGAVAGLDLRWFEDRPLFGRSVVVTRSAEQASELAERLEVLGAEVVEAPVIAVEPYAHLVATDDLSEFDWVVFTSRNAVRVFFDAVVRDARALGGVKVAVSGSGTASALAEHGVVADLVPDQFVAEALVDAMPEPGAGVVSSSVASGSGDVGASGSGDVGASGSGDVGASGSGGSDIATGAGASGPSRKDQRRQKRLRKAQRTPRVLVPRAQEARSALVEGLAAKGYEVLVMPIYRTVPVAPTDAVLNRIRSGDVDAVTFTSSSTVTNLLAALGEVPEPQPLVASMGPITSATARNAGLRIDVEAEQSTIDGLVAALVAALSDGSA